MALKLLKRGKVFYVRGTIRGKRYTESTGTHSREHAEAYRLKREREILDREFHGERNTATLGEAILVYLEKGGEGRFLEPLLDRWGKTRITELRPSIVSAFARERYGHLEPSSVRRQLYTPLNAVLRAAHRADMGPLVHFDAPKVERKPVTAASDEWLRRFFEAAHFEIAATVLFLTLTGARVSEACRLAVGDIDFARAEAVLRKTKTGRSRRVPLAPVLVDTLRGLIERGADPARVFGYASRWSVNQAIERVCARAGLTYLSSHKVGRHAFAARHLARGRSLKFVQGAGGWASIAMVADVYGHLEQSEMDKEVREAGAGFALPAPPKG